MLLEKLLDNLALHVEPFATCGVAPGWRLRLPAQDLASLHFILHGTGTLADGRGSTIPLPTNALAIVPAGLPHQLEVGVGMLAEAHPGPADPTGITPIRAGPETADNLLVACGRIRALWAGSLGLFDHLDAPLTVELGDVPHLRSAFNALLAEQRSDAPGRAHLMTALMEQCLVEFFRRLCTRDECNLPWLNALEDTRMARALEAILQAPDRDHSLASLAQTAGMSRSAFASRFREVFGRTPMEYLRDVRLRAAAGLLRQRPDLTMEAVAARAGFASRSHFSRTFRTMFGQTPSDYKAGPITP